MKAVVCRDAGGVDVLEIRDVERPRLRETELLVRVFAAGVNRADVLQRRGFYPPPDGVTDILGLEFAGEVAEVGARVEGFSIGDAVCGLVQGGAYAELVAVDARLVARIPENLSFEGAAALPEAFITANENVFVLGGLRPLEHLFVHAAASGVGTAAIQLARARGARVCAAAGGAEKCARVIELGAEIALDRHEADIASEALDWTEGRGVDVVLDLVGASVADTNLRMLADGGRWLVVGLLGGARISLHLGEVLTRRLRIFGNVIRTRSLDDRAAMVQRFAAEVLPLVADGTIQPTIDRVLPIEDVCEAHRRMEENRNVGKIILRL